MEISIKEMLTYETITFSWVCARMPSHSQIYLGLSVVPCVVLVALAGKIENETEAFKLKLFSSI